MKVIILAAGQGTRLRPYTDEKPKCMVELKGKPLLNYQLETILKCGVSKEDIALATGYLDKAIVAPGIKKYKNKNYKTTNMVATLFSAIDFVNENEDLIISYGDIIFKSEVWEKLLNTEGDLVVSADLNWLNLWSLRMENPLEDAETFKISDVNKVLEIGKKINEIGDAQAQYIGLIKIPAKNVKKFIEAYNKIDKKSTFDGNDYNNMYMTSLIQKLIDWNWDVRAAFIQGGWIEIDSVEDLNLYEKKQLFEL